MPDVADFNSKIIDEFHANGGTVGGPFTDATIVLLHTTGAKSGLERVNPVVCRIDGDNLYVFASKAGAPTNPDWFHNLVAHPDVTVEVGRDRYAARAVVLSGDERDQVYAAHSVQYPGFAEYQANTDRVIPVVRLDRVG